MKNSYLIIGVWLIFAGIISVPQTSAEPIKVIVNIKNKNKSVNRRFLSDVFLKKITFWDSGEKVIPVDLDSESDVRRDFSEQIMNRPVMAVRSYWQQMIFSGQSIPPVEFETEEQVMNYVANHANAVGYVSEKTMLNSKIKSISWK